MPMSPSLLLLLATAPAADLPAARSAAVRVHDLSKLTPAEAHELNGRRALFRVELDSPPDTEGQFVLYECVTPRRHFTHALDLQGRGGRRRDGSRGGARGV